MEGVVFLPSVLQGLVLDTEMQFYLGSVGTGAPVHYHGHAVNSMAYGEKVRGAHLCADSPNFSLVQRWVLFPPEDSFYSTKPSLRFLREEVDRVGGALQCHQRSGDVIYVPSLWGHGTLNTKESIGVAHEFSIEEFCME
jgi:oxalate decarboxylase/phosphoglucose isomerase-like protein (cupin superfamily)